MKPRIKRHSRILNRLKGKLIVSCQAPADHPLSAPQMLAAMARAAVLGGAAGLRADGPENIRAIRQAVKVPLIGIYKKRYTDSPVYITPTAEEARAAAAAGAEIIALDATNRRRPGGVNLKETVSILRGETEALLMADISAEKEGRTAAGMGFDLVATTLSGYTEETRGRRRKNQPDLDLVERLAAALEDGPPVVAEGRYTRPEQAAEAIGRGAFAVVIGSAITRPDFIAARFAQALE